MESKYDKSFILVLERIKEQRLKAVRTSDPTVENPVLDGYRRGMYQDILEVIEAYRSFSNDD